MLELNVTPLFDGSLDAYYISNSRANLGDNAGQITWNNANQAGNEFQLIDDSNRDEIISYFGDYGAWSDEELNSMTNIELSALCWQEAAADAREHWDIDNEDWSTCCEGGDEIVSEFFIAELQDDSNSSYTNIYYVEKERKFYRSFSN